MDLVTDFAQTLITQFQTPTLAFLIGGMLISASGSKLEIPDAIYRASCKTPSLHRRFLPDVLNAH